MAETYTKLFSTIVRSSVWLEDDQTLRVWVTMLALADRDGYVGASVGGLAHQARVPEEKTRAALAKFLAPDPDSRSQEHEGRRIEVADRGWLILNHERFRDMRDEEAVRVYERDKKRRQRAGKPEESPAVPGQSPVVPKSPPLRSGSSADQKADQKEEKETPSAPAAGAAPKTKRRVLVEIGGWAGPTDKHRALARELRVNLDREVTAMRDWAEAKGERKASWDAALNGWLRRAADKPAPPPGAIQHQGFRNQPQASIPSFDGFATAQRIRAEQETENQRRQEAARALRLANDGK